MFTPADLEAIPIEMERIYADLELKIMEDIVRRIKINGEITRAADWQIYRLHELGESKKAIKQMIQDALKLSNKEIDKIYKMAIKSGYVREEALYKSSGKDIIPFAKNKQLQQAIQAVKKQSLDELQNITRSLGFAKSTNGGMYMTGLTEFYQNTLDRGLMDIASGTSDYNTVLKRTIDEMTKSGLRGIDYLSGRSNRIEVAARRAVMTGVTQITNKINEDNARQLDADYFEISWHADARPSHQEWQGRVYSKAELVSVCGLGTPGGLGGVNCRHSYYPFIPGVSERSYTDEELERLNEYENTPKEFEGKKYTAYEASQYQRRLETQMRADRRKIKLLEDGGGSEDDIIAARCRYRYDMNRYVEFSKKMNIPQQRARIYGDGLGKVGVGKTRLPDIKIYKSLGAASRNYPVRLLDGTESKLKEGSKITKVYTFAGKGTKTEIRVAKNLEKQYNVPASEWKKVRGDGYVIENGRDRHCELHWYETKETGRIKMKVKRYFDEG